MGRQVVRMNKLDNHRRLEQLVRDAGLRNPSALSSSLSLLFEGALVVAFIEGKPDSGREAHKAAERLIRQHAR